MYKWTCPVCYEHVIEEVMTGVTQSSSIDSIHYDEEADIVFAEYGKVSCEGGDTDTIRYQCMQCGKPVTKEEMIQIAKQSKQE